jgi:hypothetical protein
MAGTFLHTTLTVAIALVWLINGLYCKVLNFVPRHGMIVARILGDGHAGAITKAIGVLEVFMFVWVFSGVAARLCAVVQIILVAVMNVIEFFQAPDLLLFGRMNAVIALLFIGVIYCNEFLLG